MKNIKSLILAASGEGDRKMVDKKYFFLHLICSIFISASVIIVLNEEKLVALLVHSSFRVVSTSSLHIFSLSTSSGRQSHSS